MARGATWIISPYGSTGSIQRPWPHICGGMASRSARSGNATAPRATAPRSTSATPTATRSSSRGRLREVCRRPPREGSELLLVECEGGRGAAPDYREQRARLGQDLLGIEPRRRDLGPAEPLIRA